MTTIQEIIAGLTLISAEDDRAEICAEHDQILSGGPNLSKETQIELKKLNWFYSSHEDCWTYLV